MSGCSCCHSSQPKSKKTKDLQFLIFLMIVFIVCIALVHQGMLWANILLGGLYLIAGIPVFKGAWRAMREREWFSEHSLMLFATIAAILIGAYEEAVAVMIFLRLGEYFEALALSRSHQNIAALLEVTPEIARKKIGNDWVEVHPNQLCINDRVLVRAGEKVPSDGIILKGESELNYQAITGESLPIYKHEGDEVLGGSINLLNVLEISISKPYASSSIAQLVDLVQKARQKKAKIEKFITSFSKIYTPCVLMFALCMALFPPLFLGGEWKDWIYRSLVVLMVSCPCALVLSVPLGYFGGIGGASKRGILIKGANFIEGLAKLEKIFFDKTGTLTQGTFAIKKVFPSPNTSEEELLSLASCAEHLSSHPIALALTQPAQTHQPISHRQISGMGMDAKCCNQEILAGNAALLHSKGIDVPSVSEKKSIVHIAKNGEYKGYILIEDQPREEAKACIEELEAMNIEVAILSGDHHSSVEQIANSLHIKEYYGDLLPNEKLQIFTQNKKTFSAFVGDGINDAPVLSSAEVGISLADSGSDLSKESADVILLNDDLKKIPQAIKHAKKVQSIIRENIAFALGVKGIFILLGMLGVANMWEAVFGDVGVSLIALLNAMRALRA